MIKEIFRGLTYIKLSDIEEALVGIEDADIPVGRFDSAQEVHDYFCDSDTATYNWGNNDLTFIKLSRFAADYPFVQLVLSAFDLTAEHIYVLLEE